jgi:hypothetical protein
VFGDTIVFCGPARFLSLSSSNPIIEKLVHRIDAARRGIEDAGLMERR